MYVPVEAGENPPIVEATRKSLSGGMEIHQLVVNVKFRKFSQFTLSCTPV
jgi:hypothetical protein